MLLLPYMMYILGLIWGGGDVIAAAQSREQQN
jgi:hypothetical protein